jgi:hypothetical protein
MCSKDIAIKHFAKIVMKASRILISSERAVGEL